jgi:hypothetical protein
MEKVEDETNVDAEEHSALLCIYGPFRACLKSREPAAKAVEAVQIRVRFRSVAPDRKPQSAAPGCKQRWLRCPTQIVLDVAQGLHLREIR